MPDGLWEPVPGEGDGRRHFVGGSCMQGDHLGADAPVMCTISMNLLPRKGQALSQREFSRKVPETHISLPVSKSHCNTFFFIFTQGKGGTNANHESQETETLLKFFL